MSLISKQPNGSYICFYIYKDSKVYTKYNFNFQTYLFDNSVNNITYSNQLTSNQKNTIFFHFLQNYCNYDLRDNFSFINNNNIDNYFNQSNTDNIITIYNTIGYAPLFIDFNSLDYYLSYKDIIDNEFDINYINNNINNFNKISDFVYIDNSGNYYTKYNFKFDDYKNDYLDNNNTYSKLFIFYDFLMRIYYLSGNYLELQGTKTLIGDNFNFSIYFDLSEQDNLITYLKNNSIFSERPDVKRSFYNIDFNNLYNNNNNINDLSGLNLSSLKSWFYSKGQFEILNIPLIMNETDKIQILNKSICSIFDKEELGTGFLFTINNIYNFYNDKKQIYLATCFHIIEKSSKDVLFANCYYEDNSNNLPIKLQFRIISYEKFSDICIALLDTNLEYNVNILEQYNILENDLRNNLKLLKISNSQNINIGDETIILGNLGLYDNSSYLSGKIIDANWYGDFENRFILSLPSALLININIETGCSGSPIFNIIIDDNGYKNYNLIGMVNLKLGTNLQYTIGLTGNIFYNLINNGIKLWYNINNLFINNSFIINYLKTDIYPKKWLGVVCNYYNPINAYTYNPEFLTLSYVGGISITKFILGFDTINKKFIYYEEDLKNIGVLKLDTPLLKTNMYQKYLLSNNTPILLKSITYFDTANKIFNEFNLGKFDNQYSFDLITYNLNESSAFINNDNNYFNPLIRTYNKITLKYYYYDGFKWIETTEEIGGNDDNWFNIYTDEINNFKIKQHKFEYPFILLKYLRSYGEKNNLTAVFSDSLRTINDTFEKTALRKLNVNEPYTNRLAIIRPYKLIADTNS
jgi:hypothetical protein